MTSLSRSARIIYLRPLAGNVLLMEVIWRVRWTCKYVGIAVYVIYNARFVP